MSISLYMIYSASPKLQFGVHDRLTKQLKNKENSKKVKKGNNSKNKQKIKKSKRYTHTHTHTHTQTYILSKN